jgi:hypothetical protein
MPGTPHLSAEQDGETSADASGNERHDEDNGDELGVHHDGSPQVCWRSRSNVTTKDPFVPTPAVPQTVLPTCLT